MTNVVDLSFLFNLRCSRTSAVAMATTEAYLFLKFPDGRIVLGFTGTDAGQPTLFGIEDMSAPDNFFCVTGQYELLGTLAELEAKHSELFFSVVQSMTAASVVDALSCVRMLDACLNGATPDPATARWFGRAGNVC